MVFGAKINENYESDAKELEKVVAAGILLCRTFFYSPSSHLRKRGRRGLGIILIFTSQSHSSFHRIENAPSGFLCESRFQSKRYVSIFLLGSSIS